LNHFFYREGELYCEDVPLRRIADEVGTPTYVYSTATLRRHYRAFDQPFAKVDHLVCFSVKSLSNLAVLRLFGGMGSGFDIVSGGELFRVEKSGGDTRKVVFSGVAKTESEIEYALRKNILLFNVESEAELSEVNRIAGRMRKKARVTLRVNPDVDPRAHRHISTGLKQSKFGIETDKAIAIYRNWKQYKNVDMAGVACHIGSQMLEMEPVLEALSRLVALVKTLTDMGLNIRCLDLGGGLGITYANETPPLPAQYASEIIRFAREVKCKLILEPGRVLVGNAGVLLLEVVYLKQGSEKNFVIVDGGMNDLIRPALYGAHHEVLPLEEKPVKPGYKADLVGPICESADFLARDRALPAMKAGERVAIMSAGAYGFVMASNYNSQPLPAEVLVSGNKFYVVRERETYQSLVLGEKAPAFLKKGRK